MSRIGKIPVPIPASVSVTLNGQFLSVKGPKGSLECTIPDVVGISHETDANRLVFTRKNESKTAKSLHGLFRSLVNNMVVGVSEGFRKVLLIEGIGYRAVDKGNAVELHLGYCDPKTLDIPEGITVAVPAATRIEVSGYDKQAVGQFAANIRKQRKPEPYKGKGIRYEDETVRRKPGKSFVGEEK